MIKSMVLTTKSSIKGQQAKHSFTFSSGLNVISGASCNSLYSSIYDQVKLICLAEQSRSKPIIRKNEKADFNKDYDSKVRKKEHFSIKKTNWAVFFESPNSIFEQRDNYLKLSAEEQCDNNASYIRMTKFIEYVDKEMSVSYTWLDELADLITKSKNAFEREWYVQQFDFVNSYIEHEEADIEAPFSVFLNMPTDFLNFQQKINVANELIKFSKYAQVIILTDCPVITEIENATHFTVCHDTFKRNSDMVKTWRETGATNLILGYNKGT